RDRRLKRRFGTTGEPQWLARAGRSFHSWFEEVVATTTLPELSMTIPVGPDNAADVASSPLAGAVFPPPATVLIVPSRSIERTRSPSAMSTRRDRSMSRLVG